MATPDTKPLEWTGHFRVAPQNTALSLPGDKILLPASALEQLLAAAPVINSDAPPSVNNAFDPYNPYSYAQERHARAQNSFQQQNLPQPLTFRLVNSSNNRVVFAGIREFSAEENTAGISPFLAHALDIKQDLSSHKNIEQHGLVETSLPEITVHAREVPKGTYVKLRPLEAGYNPEDWKSLLEEHMRKNFTTLSRGEVLTVPSGREQYQFLIDEFKPEGDAICVVDTDLEVDIEALNEEQARETLKKIADRARIAPGTEAGSSKGGQLDLFRAQSGQVLEGDNVDYQLPSWDRSSWLEIEVTPEDDDDELYLFANPFSSHQRAPPRSDEHVFGDLQPRGPKRLRLSPSNVELEGAEALWIAVHAPAVVSEERSPIPPPPRRFNIRASPVDKADINDITETERTPSDPSEVICKNCHKSIPSQSLFLHENFCLRNNIACPQGCGLVFQKSSPTWSTHWHCPHDSTFGDTPSSHANHINNYHTPHPCPHSTCNFTGQTLPALAQHRTTTCPGKPILCRFCHLTVPQDGDPDGAPNAEALLSGLTPHELADGARTTECHLCGRITRLRDMPTHLKHHDHERASRPRPRVCRNVNCGRTLDGVSKSGDTRAGARMGQGAGNDIGLCSVCFGPLYVNSYDPEGKALKRRVERKYLQQLLTGCGKGFCRNGMCVTGRKNGGGDGKPLATKDALPLVRPFVEGLGWGETKLEFCVDEASQRRRGLAEMMAAEEARPGEKRYAFEWCAAALEAESGDLGRAREWLVNFAPGIEEER